MRRAAFDAGMIRKESSAKLVLCLEPEAACMACEEQRLAGPGAAGINVLKIGDSFMVTTLFVSSIHPADCSHCSYIVFASHSLSMFCTHGLSCFFLPL